MTSHNVCKKSLGRAFISITWSLWYNVYHILFPIKVTFQKCLFDTRTGFSVGWIFGWVMALEQKSVLACLWFLYVSSYTVTAACYKVAKQIVRFNRAFYYVDDGRPSRTTQKDIYEISDYKIGRPCSRNIETSYKVAATYWEQTVQSLLNTTTELAITRRHMYVIIWAAPWQNQHNGFATNMDPDQPAHPHSLIRIHVVRYQFLYLL
jgi:hypothetical protein